MHLKKIQSIALAVAVAASSSVVHAGAAQATEKEHSNGNCIPVAQGVSAQSAANTDTFCNLPKDIRVAHESNSSSYVLEKGKDANGKYYYLIEVVLKDKDGLPVTRSWLDEDDRLVRYLELDKHNPGQNFTFERFRNGIDGEGLVFKASFDKPNEDGAKPVKLKYRAAQANTVIVPGTEGPFESRFPHGSSSHGHGFLSWLLGAGAGILALTGLGWLFTHKIFHR
ncbi:MULTISPECIES: hypothetical protein [Corynebacterium]|uniref:Uncharacterized protein n=1 Tax=Corynebacterium ramonii TaxID=3026968 RepID=A0ABM5RUV5_9CORY|nr:MULTISPECIES: hypothetical protein [Corynebacterium]AIU33671.1 Hypothetical protein CulFRC11_2126 [Corynebacterium ramonii FRC0011]STC80868.1 Uncharacterised protein [Corynebacterium ulcerans]